MIVTMATGSQMDRLLRCPASGALPQVYDANESKYRDSGHAMHGFLDRTAAVGRDVALTETDEKHREFCATIQTAKLADVLTLSTEVALAYDWRSDTARLLKPLEHRAYEVDATREIPLTVDLAGVAAGVVYVGDYKSGHGWLPAPHQSMQLGLGALALARLHGANAAEVEYIRVRDDGDPLRFGAKLDLFALDGVAERVHDTMTAVESLRVEVAAGATPNVTEGPWCRYCPAKAHCPAKTAIIRHIVTDAQPIPYLLPLTTESALTAYRMLAKARAAIAQIEGALYGYAKLTPIPLGEDGSIRMFGELTRPGNEEFDGAITHQVLAEIYGGEAANKAVTMEVTKKAVTETVRAALKDGETIKAGVEKVSELVRERNGSRRPITTTTTEYSIAPDGAAKARKRKAG